MDSLIVRLAKAAAAATFNGHPEWSPTLQKVVGRYFWKRYHPQGQSFHLPVSRSVPVSQRGPRDRHDPYGLDPSDEDDDTAGTPG